MVEWLACPGLCPGSPLHLEFCEIKGQTASLALRNSDLGSDSEFFFKFSDLTYSHLPYVMYCSKCSHKLTYLFFITPWKGKCSMYLRIRCSRSQGPEIRPGLDTAVVLWFWCIIVGFWATVLRQFPKVLPLEFKSVYKQNVLQRSKLVLGKVEFSLSIKRCWAASTSLRMLTILASCDCCPGCDASFLWVSWEQ